MKRLAADAAGRFPSRMRHAQQQHQKIIFFMASSCPDLPDLVWR
jgi:hypothetical protein